MHVSRTKFLPVSLLLLLTGCHHPISFHEIGYPIHSDLRNDSLVAVIGPETLQKTVSIRAFSTGFFHRWDAKPGIMLKQVADVELPQMFKEYATSESLDDHAQLEKPLTLELTVPEYIFAQFKATVTVRAVAYGADKEVLMDKTYSKEGQSQGGKMVNAGAFGMKSAVRQSSFDAYKMIFALMRDDLSKALKE